MAEVKTTEGSSTAYQFAFRNKGLPSQKTDENRPLGYKEENHPSTVLASTSPGLLDTSHPVSSAGRLSESSSISSSNSYGYDEWFTPFDVTGDNHGTVEDEIQGDFVMDGLEGFHLPQEMVKPDYYVSLSLRLYIGIQSL